MNFSVIPLFLGNLRGGQLVVIALIFLLLFGAARIPKMMRNLGKGVHAFKQGLADAQAEMEKPVEKSVPDSKKSTDAPVETTAKAKDVD